MPIVFNEIPTTINRSGQYGEVVASALPVNAIRVLLIGAHLNSYSPISHNVKITSISQAKAAYGAGSLTAKMVASFLANVSNADLTVYSIPSTETQSDHQVITITGSATNDGYFDFSFGNDRMLVPYTDGDTLTTLTTNIYNAINNNTDLAVSATTLSAATGTFNLRLKVKYPSSYLFKSSLTNVASVATSGITLTFGASTVTSSALTIAAALNANLTIPYDLIISFNVYGPEIDLLDSWLEDRWTWNKMTYGGAVISFVSNVVGAANPTNYKHIAYFQQNNDYQSPFPESAAAVGGAITKILSTDIAGVVQNISLRHVAKLATGFTPLEEEAIYGARYSMINFNGFGEPYLLRSITTYSTDDYGSPDKAWHDLETSFVVGYYMTSVRNWIASQFPRAKLVGDDSVLSSTGNSNVVSPKVIKASLVSHYDTLEKQGVVQNTVGFSKEAVVEIDANDPNRLNAFLPITLVGGFRIFAFQTKFSFLRGV